MTCKKEKQNAGYSTVWFVCVFMSVSVILLVLAEAASGYTASSEAEVITYTAGNSVLTEYKSELFNRYLIKALRASDKRIMLLNDFYTGRSCESNNGFVKLFCDTEMVSTSGYSCIERTDIFRKQVKRVMPVVNEYIMLFFGRRDKSREDTILKQEAEYVVTGGKSDEEIEKRMRAAIGLLREPINLAQVVQEPEFAGLIEADPVIGGIIAAAEAARRSIDDVDTLYNGGTLSEIGDYQNHLRVLLAAVTEKKKLQRMMDIMEMNVCKADKADFSFSTYCYGFDVTVKYGKSVPFTLGLWPLIRNQSYSGSYYYTK